LNNDDDDNNNNNNNNNNNQVEIDSVNNNHVIKGKWCVKEATSTVVICTWNERQNVIYISGQCNISAVDELSHH
jgi:hypothetical protein